MTATNTLIDDLLARTARCLIERQSDRARYYASLLATVSVPDTHLVTDWTGRDAAYDVHDFRAQLLTLNVKSLTFAATLSGQTLSHRVLSTQALRLGDNIKFDSDWAASQLPLVNVDGYAAVDCQYQPLTSRLRVLRLTRIPTDGWDRSRLERYPKTRTVGLS
jgi:hypothetical protein